MILACSECDRVSAWGTMGRCAACGAILRPEYEEDKVAALSGIDPGPGIDRYRALLPVERALPFLGEGDTPLVASQRLGPAFGCTRLYFKNEGRNPTGAFKDRAGAMAAALALEAGKEGLVTASSGNSAAALSAFATAAGIECVVLLEPGNPPGKVRQMLTTGARVVPVEGMFSHGPDGTDDMVSEVAGLLDYYPAFVWAPVNPYILEGIKTISYEVVARLPGAPDVVICPTGGGDMLAAQWRGYKELLRAGVIERLPRMIAVQSLAAPPLLVAFRMDRKRVAAIPKPASRLSGLNVPFTGEHALAAVRESGGTVTGISDEQAFATQARLAREEGVWVEPAGAASVAALPGLLAEELVDPRETIVCVLSGAGFKDSTLAAPEAQNLGAKQPPVLFEPEAVVEALEALARD